MGITLRDQRHLCRRAVCLAVACVLLAVASLPVDRAHASNASKPTSFGARAAGRGGVDIGIADDATALGTNPAGIAFTHGNRYDGTWGLLDPRVDFSNGTGGNEGARSGPIPVVPGYSMGVVFDPNTPWNLSRAMNPSQWADAGVQDHSGILATPSAALPADADSGVRYGFGVFPLTGGKVDMKIRTPFFANGQDYETDVLLVGVGPSMAYKLTDWLSVGATVQFIYGRLEVDSPIAQPKDRLAGQTIFGGTFGDSAEFAGFAVVTQPTDIDRADSFGFGGRLGVYMEPSDWLSVGLVWVSRTYMQDFIGNTRVDGNDQVNQLPGGAAALEFLSGNAIDANLGFAGNFDVRIQDFEDPDMFALGFAFRPHWRVSVGLDLWYIRWSDTKKTFKARLSNGDNLNLNILLGSDGTAIRVPLNFNDQFVVAAGVSVAVSDSLVLRGGYNWGENPQPRNTVQPHFPLWMEHHASFGFSWAFGPWELTGAVEHAFEKALTSDRNIANPDLGNSRYKISLTSVFLGVSVGF